MYITVDAIVKNSVNSYYFDQNDILTISCFGPSNSADLSL